MICLLLWVVLKKLHKLQKPHLKVATEGGPTQVESHRRIERTREASREDAIVSTRHFFATVNGKIEL